MHEVLTSNRQAEYFTQSGLRTLTGLDESRWNFAVFKELVDNALDALNECQDKRVEITLSAGGLAIFDSGPGIPEDVLDSIYDFDKYASSKRDFRTPTRGYQGNALKTIIAICFFHEMWQLSFVSNGKKISYELNQVKLDADIVSFEKNVESTDEMRSGVKIIFFPDDDDLQNEVWKYYLCNPDVTFVYNDITFKAITDPVQRSEKTFVHWYDFDAFNRLLQLTAHKDPERTTKAFCSNFSGSQRILSKLDFSYKKLSDFAGNEGAIAELYSKLCSMIVKPKPEILKNLITGEDATLKVFGDYGERKYKAIFGEYPDNEASIPYAIEGFLLSQKESYQRSKIIVAINNSNPYTTCPFSFSGEQHIQFCKKGYSASSLQSVLDQAGFFKANGLTLFINFIAPHIEFTDKSKSKIISNEFKDDLVKVTEYLCKETIKEIERAERANRSFDRRTVFTPAKKKSKVSLICNHFIEAYKHSSGDGEYLCTARQVFYALRQIINRIYKVELKKHDYNTFTQERLTNFFEHMPELEDKILFERRGSFRDPFFKNDLALSTNDVSHFVNKKYDNRIYRKTNEVYDLSPELQYNSVLFVEKQGFNEILKQSGFIKKFNIGLMSSQGFGTRALKKLTAYFLSKGIKVYVLHDCDIAGYLIKEKLLTGSRTFKQGLDVIDIGLSVQDATDMDKLDDAEFVTYRKNYKSLSFLSQEEKDFFIANVDNRTYRRVEINALTTPELLTFLESKIEHVPVRPSLELIRRCITIKESDIVKDALYMASDRNMDIGVDLDKIAQEVYQNINEHGHWTETLIATVHDYTRLMASELAIRIREGNNSI